MTDEFKQLIQGELNQLGIDLKEIQLDQFYRYYQLLTEWNKVMNLTAITEMKDVVLKHFIDSLSLIKSDKKFGSECVSVIDVGTGAGFPGIPLRIAFPNIQITLLDSLNKRIKFLEEVCNQLELDNVTMIHGRAEDFGRDLKYREQYDYCVSRAVANLSTLSEYCLAFVKQGGYFIAYKSGKIEEELQTAKGPIQRLGGELFDITEFKLPELEAGRALVRIKKTAVMSKKYPRKPGVPSKEPLR